MSQKLPLNIEQEQKQGNVTTGKTNFGDMVGEKLLNNDLIELGLEADEPHLKIVFDNEKTAKYSLCKFFLVSLSTVYLWPFYLICCCCIKYGIDRWANSRIAAVTDDKLVLKQGYYSCFCCCWNEKTKSVPLEKITDLQKQQGM